MLTDIHPKLPMRDKAITKAFYLDCTLPQKQDSSKIE
jgi:hypothetical protein